MTLFLLIVGALLTESATLLTQAAIVESPLRASLTFAADDEVVPEALELLSWEGFLERYVPGHSGSRMGKARQRQPTASVASVAS